MTLRHMSLRLVRNVALAGLIVTLALPAAAALADGDPASDVLLGQRVFFPYSPVTSVPEMRALDDATAATTRAGAPIRVALIASPVDLGVIPQLFGKPQTYAAFLDQEISFTSRQPLLVVMADGYGTQALPAAAAARVASLPPPTGRTSDALAAAAVRAVDAIAASEGHPIPGAGRSPAAATGSSSTGIILGLLAAAAIATATAIGVITVRRRRAPA
jgi:hypothetical protein